MVNNGTPSRGCDSCRESHTKCDEKKPDCARCTRLKKKCKYRNHIDILFRIQTGKTPTADPRKVDPASDGAVPITTKVKLSHNLSRPGSNPLYLLSGVNRSILPTQEDLALCYFYENILETIPVGDHARYLHLQLPSLFSRSKQSSALYFASQAISHAVWARSMGNEQNAIEISRRRYVESISALRMAIQDPVKIKSDETLYAILLLSGYETITLDLDVSSAWSSHVNGAASLLRIRGKEHMLTPFSCKMFLFIRRMTIHNHIQLSRPVDSVFEELAETVSPYENPEDRLLSKMIKIPAIQSRANEILSRCSVTESEIYELIDAAESLDLALVDWAEYVPAAWSFSIASSLSSSMDPGFSGTRFIPSNIHSYSDFYTARVWNLYRVSRLIIQSILLRAAIRHESVLRNVVDIIHIQKINRLLVDDICASVPFLLGFDMSVLRRSASSRRQDLGSLWPQKVIAQSSNSTHTGRFSLIWPLHVSCTASAIPKFQRRWIRAQLRWIAEFEPQAKLISDAQSRILFGGPEDFRFDCT